LHLALVETVERELAPPRRVEERSGVRKARTPAAEVPDASFATADESPLDCRRVGRPRLFRIERLRNKANQGASESKFAAAASCKAVLAVMAPEEAACF
jgi:hypothetical protein